MKLIPQTTVALLLLVPFNVWGQNLPLQILEDIAAQHQDLDASRRSLQDSPCHTIRVLLTEQDLKGVIYENDLFPNAGGIQGGTVALSNPQDSSEKIGDYTYLISFLPNMNCIATGAYTFFPSSGTRKEQVTFTASCSALPYFTITGGQGLIFRGSTGYVEFMIKVDQGYIHEIHLC